MVLHRGIQKTHSNNKKHQFIYKNGPGPQNTKKESKFLSAPVLDPAVDFPWTPAVSWTSADLGRPSESGRTRIGDDRPNPAEKHVRLIVNCLK